MAEESPGRVMTTMIKETDMPETKTQMKIKFDYGEVWIGADGIMKIGRAHV